MNCIKLVMWDLINLRVYEGWAICRLDERLVAWSGWLLFQRVGNVVLLTQITNLWVLILCFVPPSFFFYFLFYL